MTGEENMTGDVVMLLDENGKYLDGNFYRGHQGNIPRTLIYALGATGVEFNNLASDGLSGDFVMKFLASDGYRYNETTAYKVIEGSFDCNIGSASLIKITTLDADLNVVLDLKAGETSTDETVIAEGGWTLNETGTTICQDLSSTD